MFVVGGTGLESTALPQAGQKTVQWTVFSAWLVASRNVYRDDCGSVGGTGLEQDSSALSSLQISLYRECSLLGGCDILGLVQQIGI